MSRGLAVLLILFVIMVAVGCSSNAKTVTSRHTALLARSHLESPVSTGTWVFDGALQFLAEVRPLSYAPGNYHLQPNNQLYQVLVLAHNLNDKRALKFSAQFELRSAHRVLAKTDELRGFGGNKLIGKVVTIEPYTNEHFSVLLQAARGENPQGLRVLFDDPKLLPILLLVKQHGATARA